MADSNSLNRFQVLGFIGKDPELRTAKPSGRKFAVIDVATQQIYKNQKKAYVTWHTLQVWGETMAPWAAKNIKKGMQVDFQGFMSRRWVGQEGDKSKIVDFKVEKVTILRQKYKETEEDYQEPVGEKKGDPY